MKLSEIKPITQLSNEQCEFVIRAMLSESIDSEFHQIVKNNAIAPFTRFKNETVKTLAPKLKAWALSVMHQLKREDEVGATSELPAGLKTVQKIVNDPLTCASQILGYITNGSKNGQSLTKPADGSNDDIIAKGSKPNATPAEIRAKTKADAEEMAKIDDVLSTLTF